MKLKLAKPLQPGWPDRDMTCDPILVDCHDGGTKVVVMGSSEAILFAKGSITHASLKFVKDNYRFVRKLEQGESFSVEV